MKPARVYVLILLVVLSLVAVGVIGLLSDGRAFVERAPPEFGVNLIAYADPDGRIMISRPDGSAAVKMSPEEGFFTWPAWSPDGTQLAFSGIPLRNRVPGGLTLYHVELDEAVPQAIFENAPGTGPILNRMPHYPIWAPDSGSLAIMASTPQGLTLLVVDPREGEAPGVLIRRAPLYASWSSDSSRLVVHGGPDHFVADVEGGTGVRDLGVRALSYRVPAWWPSGDKIVYLRDDRLGRTVLYVADVDSDERTLLQQVDGGAAFLWSPNGRRLAVGYSRPEAPFVYEGVALFTPEGVRLSVEIAERVLAFFWSPDGQQLAYVVPGETRNVLRLMVMDVATGDGWPLVDFTPSPEQVTMYQFFDQFAYSHAQWSPDSEALLFTGILSGEGVSASLDTQQASQIFVVGAQPFSPAERVAAGVIAVWSPR